MYLPEQFAVTEAADVAEMLARAPLGALITHGPRGLFASHIPFVHDVGGGLLQGHLARANQHQHEAGAEEALVIFQGLSAYVSPNWYPSKSAHGQVVPTWNYEVVHLYGDLTWRDDRDWLLANVSALTERFERVQATPWALTDAPADYIERMVTAIVGVELRITRVEAKRKLSQNRSEIDRQGVIEGLSTSPSPIDVGVAVTMRGMQR